MHTVGLLNLQGAAPSPGTLDASFAPDAYYDGFVEKNMPLPDGRVFAMGTFRHLSGIEQSYLARINRDGTVDESFRPQLNSGVRTVILVDGGRLLVGGSFTEVNGVACDRLVRLNADGSTDRTFHAKIDGPVSALLQQSDGRIVVGGAFQNANDEAHANLVRLMTDGSSDASFHVNCDKYVMGLSPHPNGGFFATGDFITIDGVARSRIALFDSEGVLNQSFAADANGRVESVIVQPDGSALVAGRFTAINSSPRNRIARVLPDGSLDSSFDPDVSMDIYAMALQTDGKIVICGAFSRVGGTYQGPVARLYADGKLDRSLVCEWKSRLYLALSIQGDGNLIISGDTFATPDCSMTNVARLLNAPAPQTLSVVSPDRVEWLRGGSACEVDDAIFDVSIDGGVTWSFLGKGSRITGGWQLTNLNLTGKGVLRARGAFCPGSCSGTWVESQSAFSFAGETPVPILTVEGPDGTELVSDASIVQLGENRVPKVFTVRNMGEAPLEITGLQDMDAGYATLNIDQSGMLSRIPAGGSTRFAVKLEPLGNYEHSNSFQVLNTDASKNPFVIRTKGPGGPNSRIGLTGVYVSRMDYQTYYPGNIHYYSIAPALSRYISDYAVTVENNAPQALIQFDYSQGGDFPTVTLDGQPTGRAGIYLESQGLSGTREFVFTAEDGVTKQLVRLKINRQPPQDGDYDLSFNPSFNKHVDQAILLPDGAWLTAGSFTIDGKSFTGIVRVLQDGSIDPKFRVNLSSGFSGMAATPDNKYYAWSRDLSVPGIGWCSLLRFREDGTLDKSFNPPSFHTFPLLNFPVRALAVQNDGKVLIAGDFGAITNFNHQYVARLNSDGSADETFIVNVNGPVTQVIVQQDGRILLAGQFTQINGRNMRLARVLGNGSIDETFVPPAELTGAVSALAIVADGGIYVCAPFSGTSALRRLSPNGATEQLIKSPETSSVGFAVRTDKGVMAVSETNVSRLNVDPLNGYDIDRLGQGLDDSIGTYMLGHDGTVLVGGYIGQWMGIDVNGLVRLHDAKAPEMAAPSSAAPGELTWRQPSGSGPAVERVYFQWRADTMAEWKLLAAANYVGDEWVVTGVVFPSTGLIRAVGTVRSGAHNLSQGLISSPALELAPGPARISVSTLEEVPIEEGDKVDFGPVALKNSKEVTLLIRNSGRFQLETGTPFITGPAAASFVVVSPPDAVVFQEDRLVLRFAPQTAEIETAVLHIPTNDPDRADDQILLTGMGVARKVLAIVKTLPAEVTGPESATLKGEVDPKGYMREVLFEYGPTNKYGMTMGAAEGIPYRVEQAGMVQANLPGLRPNTKYHYRIVARSAVGTTIGADTTFTTANRPPTAADDRMAVAKGITAIVDVLANDTDPDHDGLRLISVALPPPSHHARVTKSGNAVLVTLDAQALYPVTFHYTLSDGHGGTSTAAVSIEDETGPTVTPKSLVLSPSGDNVFINVTSQSGLWSAKSTGSWLRLESSYGQSPESLQLIAAANPTKNSRFAQVIFADGTKVDVDQLGSCAPVVSAPPAAAGIVGFQLSIPLTVTSPANLSAAGLPPGLKISAAGRIEGVPTRAGTYKVTVRANNSVGPAASPANLTISISPMPGDLDGNYIGMIGSPSASALPGSRPLSRFELTIGKTGAVSGKFYTGTTSKAFAIKSGALTGSLVTPVLSVPIADTQGAANNLVLKFNVGPNRVGGTFAGNAVDGWRQVWLKTVVTPFGYWGDYSMAVATHDPSPAVPQGYGFAFVHVDRYVGTYKMSGNLADGSPLLTTGFVGPSGELIAYQALIKDKATFGGVWTLSGGAPLRTVNSYALWARPAAAVTDKSGVYPGGFEWTTCTVTGGSLPSLQNGGVMLGLDNIDDNAVLNFNMGGLSPNGEGFGMNFSLRNPSSRSLTNEATFPSENPNSVKLTTVKATMGYFAGEFKLPGSNGEPARRATFFGQAVNQNSRALGYGYFLLPQAPSNPAGAPVPVLSGTVIMQGK